METGQLLKFLPARLRNLRMLAALSVLVTTLWVGFICHVAAKDPQFRGEGGMPLLIIWLPFLISGQALLVLVQAATGLDLFERPGTMEALVLLFSVIANTTITWAGMVLLRKLIRIFRRHKNPTNN